MGGGGGGSPPPEKKAEPTAAPAGIDLQPMESVVRDPVRASKKAKDALPGVTDLTDTSTLLGG